MNRLEKLLPPFTAVILGCAFALATAMICVGIVEKRSQEDVERVLRLNGYDWVNVSVDGLRVILHGEAPDESIRFRASTAVGTVLDATRIHDEMNVAVIEPIKPPRFSIEILRNDDGVSLIGLVPAAMDRETIVETIAELSGESRVADLLDEADFPKPDGWDLAVSFGMDALGTLPRSKISIAADQVGIIAISESIEEKRQLESKLLRQAPSGLPVTVEINAPRPVITPFTLRFLISDGVPRFDACSTGSAEGRDKILRAARDAGLEGKAECTIGLGIPSPQWDSAVGLAIRKLGDLGEGSITFSDADVTLVASDQTPQGLFDRIVGELENDLPDVFSLHAVLPDPVEIDGTGEGEGPPEFIATRSPEGLVQLRGRISDERARSATESFARALFGSENVYPAMRMDENLPNGWTSRVLASLEALALLNNGSAIMQSGFVEIRGKTGVEDATATISRILSDKLGERENFNISVTYEEKLDPLAVIPTPEECVSDLNAVMAEQKITFEPASADIDTEGRKIIAKIAEVMKGCEHVRMEVGGHTDSQGREVMNLGLSQARAEAIINALLARRILTSNLNAIGYGETKPIADNDTEEGREENRRIEFKLVTDDAERIDASTLKTEEGVLVIEASEDDPRPLARPSRDGTAGNEDNAAGQENEQQTDEALVNTEQETTEATDEQN